MVNKRVFVLLVAFIIIAFATAFMYFKYWQEPEAKYIQTDNPKLAQIRKNLSELKADLRKKGVYNCCIRNDCNWCALYMGHCPCADIVSARGNEKSCPECAAAWNKKQGRLAGVDPDAIKVTTFGIYGFEKGGHHYPGKTPHHGEEHHHQH